MEDNKLIIPNVGGGKSSKDPPDFTLPLRMGWKRETMVKNTDFKLIYEGNIFYITPQGVKVRTFINISFIVTFYNSCFQIPVQIRQRDQKMSQPKNSRIDSTPLYLQHKSHLGLLRFRCRRRKGDPTRF